MPTTITLTPQINTLKPTKGLGINLVGIFRTKAQLHKQTFKIALEALSLLSLFAAVFVWMFILKTI